MDAPANTNLGFLTVLQEPVGFVGGYLVTNPWGRPLEFRLSTAVQPNRIQQILYGDTLLPYVCGELIAKTLYEKTTARPWAIITDQQAVLTVRRHLSVPVAYLQTSPDRDELPTLATHPDFPEDARIVRDKLERDFDCAEPFVRLREAISEARKLGVTKRG